MKQRLFNLLKDKGFALTFVLSFTLLCTFFGKPLFHANSVYFGVDGDGIQAYYTSLYHAKWDESFVHFKGMNYPYGENVFFTGCQPTVTGFCSLFGLSNYIIGVTNLIMLLSIVVCALFLYLIFKELKIHYLYAAITAVAISFLSPQIVRMHAHYTLTYQFAIPGFIYLLMKFYRAPSLRRSLLIGVYSFFMASTHLYFFGFFAVISAFYWGTLFVLRENNFKNIIFSIKHFSIQLLIPFVILQLMTVLTNTYYDRTQMPFGFLLYKSNWWGTFFPFGRYYEYLPIRWGLEPQYVNEEGFAYVGLIAVIVSAIITLKLVRDALNFEIKKFFMFSDNLLLNIFVWSSIAALLYSFAYPFVFGHEEWVKHLGFLKQMRAVARFAWVYYYVGNILAVYLTYQFIQYLKWNPVKITFLLVICFFYCADAYETVRGYNNVLNNRLTAMEDKNNVLSGDAWIKQLKVDDYQAIIPMPYFHTGSENYNIEPKGEIKKNAFIVSLKTGLPITAVNLSRTSLSQSFKNIELMLEPSEPLKILEDMPNKKPFLVMIDKDLLNQNEWNIISNCKLLFRTQAYNVLQLDYDALANMWKKERDKVINEYKSAKTFKQGDYYSTDSVIRFVRVNYDSLNSEIAFRGKGAKKVMANKYSDLYYGGIPNLVPDVDYAVSFWMHNYVKDINLRTAFAVDFVDSVDVSCGGGIYSTVKDNVKRMEGDWALVEGTVKCKHKNDRIKITLWNEHLNKNDSLIYDELLIRPSNVNIYKDSEKNLYKNNRTFIKAE